MPPGGLEGRQPPTSPDFIELAFRTPGDGRAASCSLLLTASETRQERPLRARKSILHIAVLWRSDGGKQDGSNSEAPASAEVDAVSEGQFATESAA